MSPSARWRVAIHGPVELFDLGPLGRTRLHVDLLAVEDEALADEWVEHRVERAGEQRAALDVPDEEPVVGGDERVVGAVDPDQATEPPVRRVQAVAVVAADDGEARAPATSRSSPRRR